MKTTIEGAIRLSGFDKPTVWTIMTPLAIKTESANLVKFCLIRAKAFHHGSLQISIKKILKKPSPKVLYSFIQVTINTYVLLVH
jgi:hypothetical protein